MQQHFSFARKYTMARVIKAGRKEQRYTDARINKYRNIVLSHR